MHRLIHRLRYHLSTARNRHDDIQGATPRGGIASFGHQPPRLGRVMAEPEGWIAEPRIIRRHLAACGQRRAGKQRHDTVAVYRQIGRLPHPEIGKGAAFSHIQTPGPDMRVGILHHLKAGSAQ